MNVTYKRIFLSKNRRALWFPHPLRRLSGALSSDPHVVKGVGRKISRGGGGNVKKFGKLAGANGKKNRKKAKKAEKKHF